MMLAWVTFLWKKNARKLRMSLSKITIKDTSRHSQFTYIQSDIQLDINFYDIEIWNHQYTDIQFDWDIC